jgi:hypothetical protein
MAISLFSVENIRGRHRQGETQMLRLAKDLKDYKLSVRDGDIGKAEEFYFDDRSWAVRYLIADTGGWLGGRQVLISPYALDPARKDDQVIPVDLAKKQIENSPSLDTDKPVSRQYEIQYYSFYGWPAYWGGLTLGVHPPTRSDKSDGPQPLVTRKMMTRISAARRMLPAARFRPGTERSVTSRILWWMTRIGRFAT